MIDMTSVDSLKDNLSFTQSNNTIDDYDEFEILRKDIMNQIIHHENLGIDLIKDIDNKQIKLNILTEIIHYADDNYVDIIDIDNILISNLFINEIGYYIYLFLAVDCFNSIFPNFIKLVRITSYDHFETYLRTSNLQNYTNIKNKILKSTQQIIDPLLKLQNIDPSVSKDIKYKAFLKRLTYELDLIDYGDFSKFVENYMKSVFRKNFTQILWRAL